MERWLGRYSEIAYALLRLFAGTMFACHGAAKLFGVLGGKPQLDNPQMLIAGIIEFFGGILIAVGLQAGYAAFLSSGQMAFAYFMAHAPGGFWPILNKGELAVVYCFLFLYIATKGSGAWSLDAAIRRKR